MNACPIIHVTKAAPVFQYDTAKPIRLGLSPDDAQKAITEIKERVDTYDRACKPATIAATKTEDGAEVVDRFVTKSIANGKMRIVNSSMEKGFLEKYKTDLLRYSTATDTLLFLKQIFGEQNERQRQTAARSEITHATRRVSDNEPFVLFLNRLKSMAVNTSKTENIRQDLIENAFRSNLSPAINMFLLEHDQLEKEVDEIAHFLDSKSKNNKIATVNALQLNKMEQMEQMILNLTQLVQESLSKNNDMAT